MSPDHHAKDERNYALKEEPPRDSASAGAKVDDDIDQPLRNKKDDQCQCECSDSQSQIEAKVESGDEIDNGDESFPDPRPNPLGAKGVNELHHAADHQQPGDGDDHAE